MGLFFKTPEEVDKYFDKITESLLVLKARTVLLLSHSEDTLEYFALYDSILTQVRALFIENSQNSNNYTVQVFLNKLGLANKSKEIDEYLNNELVPGVSIKKAIKVSVDKFIVHYDLTSSEEDRIEEICRKHLINIENEFFIGKLIDIISGDMILSYVERMNNWTDNFIEE